MPIPYLSTTVEGLTPEQRQVLQESADARRLAAIPPESLRGNDPQLHDVWARAVQSGQSTRNVDNAYIAAEADERTRQWGGDPAEHTRLVSEVYRAGLAWGGRLQRMSHRMTVEQAEHAVLQSRLNGVHNNLAPMNHPRSRIEEGWHRNIRLYSSGYLHTPYRGVMRRGDSIQVGRLSTLERLTAHLEVVDPRAVT